MSHAYCHTFKIVLRLEKLNPVPVTILAPIRTGNCITIYYTYYKLCVYAIGIRTILTIPCSTHIILSAKTGRDLKKVMRRIAENGHLVDRNLFIRMNQKNTGKRRTSPCRPSISNDLNQRATEWQSALRESQRNYYKDA